MNEDEAFIRAIVDAPGDDTARLVYADWLDEHDDPRGTYLRAELEWAKRKPKTKEKEFRKLASALDAVWIARVTRPPLGVCVESQTLRRIPTEWASRTTTTKAIDKVARQFKITFPPEYIAFLLNYNGGWLANSPKDVLPDEMNDHLHSTEFLSEYAEAHFADCHESNRGLFPIGSMPVHPTGSVILLGVREKNATAGNLFGSLFEIDWGNHEEPWFENGEFREEEFGNCKIADSLPAWFAQLK